MAEFHELTADEQDIANASINHMNENSFKIPGSGGKYPLTIQGVKDYINDHQTEIVLRSGYTLASSAVGATYGPKVLKYLEKKLKAL